MAVYTRVDENELNAFLADYDLGRATSFSGITEGVENSNYRLSTTEGEFILTLYEKRVNTDDLPFFVDLMAHMADHSITCPQPVADRNGVVLKTLNGRSAAIFTFLNGTSNNSPPAARCYSAGQILARMHRAGADFSGTRANALDHLAWGPLLAQSDKGVVDYGADNLPQDLTARARARLDDTLARWPDDLPRGVIHADLFPDNVLFVGDDVTGVIDFYFACQDFLAYDLAIMMNAWCFEADGSFNVTKSRELVNGYQSERRLSADEINALPILCRGSAMRFFLTRLYDWIHTPKDAQVRPHDPMAYWTRLNFHHNVDSPSAYGIKAPS
ncbi:MAG: homoserine kinase [Alphaproteobacteria bacterium]|nr:homoserine kinase [Alphaproteobacteria bacterium]